MLQNVGKFCVNCSATLNAQFASSLPPQFQAQNREQFAPHQPMQMPPPQTFQPPIAPNQFQPQNQLQQPPMVSDASKETSSIKLFLFIGLMTLLAISGMGLLLYSKVIDPYLSKATALSNGLRHKKNKILNRNDFFFLKIPFR